MFSTADFKAIPKWYFKVKHEDCYNIVLVSKNTGHQWHLYSASEYPSTKIFHSHKEGGLEHEHEHARNFRDAIRRIQSHDRYQLDKDAQKAKKHRLKNK